MYNFLHKHKDYVIRYCIIMKVLLYILRQLLKAFIYFMSVCECLHVCLCVPCIHCVLLEARRVFVVSLRQNSNIYFSII